MSKAPRVDFGSSELRAAAEEVVLHYLDPSLQVVLGRRNRARDCSCPYARVEMRRLFVLGRNWPRTQVGALHRQIRRRLKKRWLP